MSRSTASSPASPTETGTARVKRGMADMLKGGVIMDVVTPEQAKIAEDAGAGNFFFVFFNFFFKFFGIS